MPFFAPQTPRLEEQNMLVYYASRRATEQPMLSSRKYKRQHWAFPRKFPLLLDLQVPQISNLVYSTSIMGIWLKKPEDVPGASWPAIAISSFVAFGGILFG
jgi:hypothetical protein